MFLIMIRDMPVEQYILKTGQSLIRKVKENSHIKIHSEKLLLKIFHWVDSINNDHYIDVGFLCGSGSKGSACNSGDQGLTPGSDLEKVMATHSSIFAWRIPWTEEPGRQQSMGSEKELDMIE